MVREYPELAATRERGRSPGRLAMISYRTWVEESFQLIREQVESLGLPGEPAGGYVLTGGVMSTPHILGVARSQLGHAVRMIFPEGYRGGDPLLHRRGGNSSLHPATLAAPAPGI